jgi:DNA mismatch endonuclease, patch repair protein
MADTLSKDRRSWNMSRIRARDTKPELRLRSLLHRMGYRFRLHDLSLPGRPDIVLKKHRTVVFVNGCFWHRHAGCANATVPSTRVDFWESKFAGTVERDRQQRNALADAGWRVITVWECDIKKQPHDVVARLRDELGGAK